jgi:hypothetical protein
MYWNANGLGHFWWFRYNKVEEHFLYWAVRFSVPEVRFTLKSSYHTL